MFYRFFFKQEFYVFFRENVIAGYYYLETLNCKSISFPATYSPRRLSLQVTGIFVSEVSRPFQADEAFVRGLEGKTTWSSFLDRPGTFSSPKQTT